MLRRRPATAEHLPSAGLGLLRILPASLPQFLAGRSALLPPNLSYSKHIRASHITSSVTLSLLPIQSHQKYLSPDVLTPISRSLWTHLQPHTTTPQTCSSSPSSPSPSSPARPLPRPTQPSSMSATLVWIRPRLVRRSPSAQLPPADPY